MGQRHGTHGILGDHRSSAMMNSLISRAEYAITANARSDVTAHRRRPQGGALGPWMVGAKPRRRQAQCDHPRAGPGGCAQDGPGRRRLRGACGVAGKFCRCVEGGGPHPGEPAGMRVRHRPHEAERAGHAGPGRPYRPIQRPRSHAPSDRTTAGWPRPLLARSGLSQRRGGPGTTTPEEVAEGAVERWRPRERQPLALT